MAGATAGLCANEFLHMEMMPGALRELLSWLLSHLCHVWTPWPSGM